MDLWDMESRIKVTWKFSGTEKIFSNRLEVKEATGVTRFEKTQILYVAECMFGNVLDVTKMEFTTMIVERIDKDE